MILHGKTFNMGHWGQVSQPGSSVPSMLTGTIDHKYLISLSVALILSIGVIISRSKTCSVHFLTLFPVDHDEVWCGVEAGEDKTPDTISEMDLCNQRNNFCFVDCVKNFEVGMYSEVYELIFVQTRCDDICYYYQDL